MLGNLLALKPGRDCIQGGQGAPVPCSPGQGLALVPPGKLPSRGEPGPCQAAVAARGPTTFAVDT